MIEYCCETLRDRVNEVCVEHDNECPDILVIRTTRGYGLPIRDGGSSYVEIMFCPWCGQRV